MSYLDGVPFRTAKSLEEDLAGQNTFIDAPAIDLPDCTDILMSTMVGWPFHVPFRWDADGDACFGEGEEGKRPSWCPSHRLLFSRSVRR